ncbi:helix-turn-helix transcriptional regulator [Methylobacillus sp.]|uniref:helix-turn-helix domain-containing protein n=1 Tax=Methylobacillus sp. TaxID=56818 RepID=UPI0012C8F1A4|nr:helix-turn-helix transcriptional regulator [Methylobacillus sp.]MPS48467.1 XRE family transcriptional regulator [Methylobacillus sp.]
MAAKSNKVENLDQVASFLTQQILLSDKTQGDIAVECGYQRHTQGVISQFKNGRTKVPINVIRKLALAIHVDPLHLFQLVTKQDEPVIWEFVEEALERAKGFHVTENEKKLLTAYRESVGVHDPEVSDELMTKFKAWTQEVRAEHDAKIDSAIRAKVL